MKKILLRAYVAKNFGDDLFLKILFERYPEVKFRLLYNQPGFLPEFIFQYRNVELIKAPQMPFWARLFFKLISLVNVRYRISYFLDLQKRFFDHQAKENDAFLYIGGSMFMQLNDQLPLDMYCNEIAFKAFEKNASFVIGANFGPYITNDFLDNYRRILAKITDVSFRDQASFNLFSKLKNVRRASDIVFCLRPPEVKKIPGSVGISIMNFSTLPEKQKYSPAYFKLIADVVSKLVFERRCVKLFSFCAKDGDLEGIKTILQMIPAEIRSHVGIVSYSGDIDKFLNDFAIMETIIATRFHSMILGLLCQQFVFPIIYCIKVYNVLRDIDFQGEVLFLEKVEEMTAESLFEKLGKYFHSLNHELKNATMQFKGLDAFLSEKFKA